jgi:endoglucanase
MTARAYVISLVLLLCTAPSLMLAPLAAQPSFQIGVNLSQMECGDRRTPDPPANFAALQPYFAYWRSQNVLTIRLPFSWERIQPILGGPLDATFLGYIKQAIQWAAQNGQTVLLDLHNYARYTPSKGVAPIALGTLSLGPPYTNYANVWLRLATVFKQYSNILGYDIMNEPHNLMAGVWPAAAQAAINAIRSVDRKTTIFVEGDGWASANGWPGSNPTLQNLKDPSNALIFSAHNYANQGCQRFAVFNSCDTTQTMVNNFKGNSNTFGHWLTKYGLRGHIGEGGVGQDPNLLTMLDNAIAAYKAANIPFHYWAGGPCAPRAASTNASVNPASFGPPPTGIPPQTAVLKKYTSPPSTPPDAAEDAAENCHRSEC